MPRKKKVAASAVAPVTPDYRSLPALRAYIDGIGAVQLNFRRFMVKEFIEKYYIEKVIIRLDEQGNISCNDLDYAPTEEQAAAIALEVTAANWPKSMVAGVPQYREFAKRAEFKKSILYPMHGTRNGNSGVIMVQERRETEDGKIYVPWTLFTDGQWYSMEPDGDLPFYKPEKKRSNFIMVHEGAKAAKAAAELPNDHPWHEELSKYDHWGILGGALAPHRADYAELQKAAPSRLIYVCDNDEAGHKVITTFARKWGKELKYVMFGKNFKPAFDVADPIPEEMFADGEYVGPTFEELYRPATLATIAALTDDGKRYHYLTDAFKKEWRCSVVAEKFINKEFPHTMYTEAEFNHMVRPFSHVENTARLLRAVEECKVEKIDYDPASKPGEHTNGNNSWFNCYRGSAYRPKKGDVSIFLEYMKHLIPNEHDLGLTLKWIATLIARPDIRMTYSILLISEKHGVGKTTLGEKILMPIIGRDNTSFPQEHDIVESAFNGWIVRKRLAVVSEIYTGRSTKAYKKLKTVISDQEVQVNEKYSPTYAIKNWLHVVASSNSMRALRLENDDRRWLVPTVAEEGKPHKFWVKLNRWLTSGGYSKIMHWAAEYVEEHGPVKEGEHAPTTKRKEEVIEEGYSPGLRLVRDYLMTLAEEAREQKGGKPIWTTDGIMQDYIRERLHNGRYVDHIENPRTIRSAASALGWHCGEKPSKGTKIGGLEDWRHKIITMDKSLLNRTFNDLCSAGITPRRPEVEV